MRRRKKRPWQLQRALAPLRRQWTDAVAAPRKRAILAAAVLAVVLGALVARAGTAVARGGAALALALLGAACGAWLWRERRLLARPRAAIDLLFGRVDRALADRALRALSLLDDAGEVRHAGVSPVLARLHVSRALASLPEERVAEAASRSGRRLSRAMVLLAVAAAGAFASSPWGVFEGLDVLLARRGVAPVSMAWLVAPEIRARPPDYLHLEERAYGRREKLTLPRGTLLTFRGEPAHAGRRLALRGAGREVPFVDDGAGAMVARWPVADDVQITVVARFGDVVIEEPFALDVASIADEAPAVTLEGAPRRVALARESTTEIPVRYEATDDHGLREVHLVLRAGAREERRVLARLDGETKRDSGGYVLRVSDPFVRRSRVPVELSVEARDNDPITGPKWGASAPITLVPPEVGEPEALRLAALRALLDALVDGLAWRLEHAVPAEAPARGAFVDEERRGVEADAAATRAALGRVYAGVRVPSRVAAMIASRAAKVEAAMRAEERAASTATHAALVLATEKLVLVVDGASRGLAQRDARTAARALADSADDLALGLEQTQRAGDAERSRGAARTEAATSVLGAGRQQLARLGVLGRDLGEIVEADLVRVGRGRVLGDLAHAEIAARDLAARLRQPDPSFGAKGSFGRGVSGGGDDGEGERAFDAGAQELERLAQDHAGEIGKVEDALAGREAGGGDAEAREHAKAVRDAARPLPSVGAGSDSWTSKGAAARELTEQMARALEEGQPADAAHSGRLALQAMEEARKIAGRERLRTYRDRSADDAAQRLDEAKRKLDPEVSWAEQRAEQTRKRAAERARPELDRAGREEDAIADRAGKLGRGARERGALPDEALDSIDAAERAAREAARELERGDAERGLGHQREAQRRLEDARRALGRDEEEGEPPARGGEGGRETTPGHADVPKAEAHKGPEEFRRRVVRGLAQPAPAREKDAVQRYAEGLLR